MGKAAVFKKERKTQIDRQKLDYNVCISDCVKYVTKGITIYSTPLYPSEKGNTNGLISLLFLRYLLIFHYDQIILIDYEIKD